MNLLNINFTFTGFYSLKCYLNNYKAFVIRLKTSLTVQNAQS